VTPTFVFDGDCAFCSTCARFIERFMPSDARVVAWQRTDIAALGLTAAQCAEAVQWVDPDTGVSAAGPEAIARLLRSSRWYWRIAGWLLDLRPVRAIAWPLYRWVAANREKMPGGTAACAIDAHR
jgi:predicted DCC family thiol-disulfide oxidoreductase YuxK